MNAELWMLAAIIGQIIFGPSVSTFVVIGLIPYIIIVILSFKNKNFSSFLSRKEPKDG